MHKSCKVNNLICLINEHARLTFFTFSIPFLCFQVAFFRKFGLCVLCSFIRGCSFIRQVRVNKEEGINENRVQMV